MCEIVCAVDGVNEPPDLLGASRGLLEDFALFAFFCDKAVVGIIFLDTVDDDFLAFFIGLGDHFIAVFDRGFNVAEFFHGPLTGQACSDDCGFEQSAHESLFEYHFFTPVCCLDMTRLLAYSNAVMDEIQQVNKPKIFVRVSLRHRFAGGVVFFLVVGSVVGLALAAHYKIELYPYPCGFRQVYGLPCPGCGMTTSAEAFARGRIFEAFYIQPAAAFLCCVVVIAAFLAFIMAAFGVNFRFLKRFFAEVKIKYIIFALFVVVMSGWAVTLSRALAAMNK